jgi:hypothetical protein
MSFLSVIIETLTGSKQGKVIGQTTDPKKANDIARSRMEGKFSKSGDTYKNNKKAVDVVKKSDLRDTY